MNQSVKNIAILCLSGYTCFSQAGIIGPASNLLDETGATYLETQLGLGDLDWNSIWYGTTGATAASWHNAVDGVSNTVSIYNITYNNANYLIGGYNANAWSSSGYYTNDTDGTFDNFIFNLTDQFTHDGSNSLWQAGQYATFDASYHFATFGGGHDLYGGHTSLGSFGGYSNHSGTYNGNSVDHIGNIVTGDVNDGFVTFTVNSLETFAFSPATSVPEPGSLALLTLGLAGLGISRRKKLRS